MKRFVGALLLTGTALLVACGQPQPAPLGNSAPREATEATGTANTAIEPTTAPPAPTVVPTPPQPPAGADPKQAVLDAVTALESAGPYRVTQRIEAESGTSEPTVEVVPPDRRRVVFEGMEMITIGPRRWSKLDGVWSEQPSDGGLPLVGLSAEQLADGLLENAEALGTVELDGTPTNLYRFEGGSDISGVVASQVLTIWVDAARGLPLQVEADGIAEGVATMMRMTYEYSDAIMIEPPLP